MLIKIITNDSDNDVTNVEKIILFLLYGDRDMFIKTLLLILRSK